MDVLSVPSHKIRLEHEHLCFISTFLFVVENLPFSKLKTIRKQISLVQAAQDPSAQP